MDRCIKEKESLYQLKSDEEMSGLTHTTGTIKSYFIPYPERDYLMEYSFETAAQLKEKFSVLCADEKYKQDIGKTLLAAAMKNKPLDRGNSKLKANSGQDAKHQIPEFIYSF